MGPILGRMLNVTDGSFPSEFSTGRPELIDEERRLLYVAMTRAEKHLFITHAATRTLFGRRRDPAISRFLSPLTHPAFRFEQYGFVKSSRRNQDSKQMDLFS